MRALAEMGDEVLRGKQFADVAKARSQGLTADKGGQRDWTSKGALRSNVLDEAIFGLPVGTMSRILEDEDGFHIIRVIERKEAGAVPVKDAQVEIKNKLKEERSKKQTSAYLDKLRGETAAWTILDNDSEPPEDSEPPDDSEPPGKSRPVLPPRACHPDASPQRRHPAQHHGGDKPCRRIVPIREPVRRRRSRPAVFSALTDVQFRILAPYSVPGIFCGAQQICEPPAFPGDMLAPRGRRVAAFTRTKASVSPHGGDKPRCSLFRLAIRSCWS